MGKSKKTKAQEIDPRILTRPRLDALFEQQALGEVGLSTTFDALVICMEGTPENVHFGSNARLAGR